MSYGIPFFFVPFLFQAVDPAQAILFRNRLILHSAAAFSGHLSFLGFDHFLKDVSRTTHRILQAFAEF